jgi:cytochrome b
MIHWLLAGSFAGAYLSAESERWQLVHITLGYTFAGLIVFRLLWGLFGTRYARFSQFLPSPAKAWQYARSVLGMTQAPHYVGHNPLGALAIYALLALGIAVSVTGYASWQELGGEWLEQGHELAAEAMLALVALHIAGVLISSVAHKENLVRGMIDGKKQGEPAQAIKSPLNVAGVVLLTLVLAFWLVAWQQPSLIGLVADNAENSAAVERDEGHQAAGDDDPG